MTRLLASLTILMALTVAPHAAGNSESTQAAAQQCPNDTDNDGKEQPPKCDDSDQDGK
jgi:hypothetical protein